jgi:hypothetical protein
MGGQRQLDLTELGAEDNDCFLIIDLFKCFEILQR